MPRLQGSSDEAIEALFVPTDSGGATLEGTNAVEFSTVGWAIAGGVTGALGGFVIGNCVALTPIVGSLLSATSWGITGAVSADTVASFSKKKSGE
eukprot:CAMPEP_0174386464 /NCGR_PEP_ID=MMETSP0811_2-20130205/127295_1 /TAXON_ID=73025 ORGANISM="Eutreptiella gymnastica-like, Strain CCMP1594" /NCGR_SAMPLE_ID=MMETSP0811_2 /ASSEMBLY_ACC=CAM_ASM_000667 /LENGTH=94 /DNA_ID=CAMNT_0015541149 /DNA_START=81 /DNA_END=365 /DNA_ORIENTATION=+